MTTSLVISRHTPTTPNYGPYRDLVELESLVESTCDSGARKKRKIEIETWAVGRGAHHVMVSR